MSVLSDQELDRMENLLESSVWAQESMFLDEIQGFFCAILSGPEVIPPAQWLPEVLGSKMAENLAAAETRELIDLLIRFYNQHAEALLKHHGFPLYIYPETEPEGAEEDEKDMEAGEGEEEAVAVEGLYGYGLWCEAYLHGVYMGQKSWADAAGEHEERLAELLEPFYLLTGILKKEAKSQGEKWMSPEEEARLLEDRKENLQRTVQDIYDFWFALRMPVTSRRTGPKIGRNELCPCDSGKKYKQCCGSPEKLN